MQLEKVLNQLKESLGAYKNRGDEIIFKECPWCNNDKWNFEVNSVKLKWHCWVCGKGGNLPSLLNFMDIQYTGDLPLPPKERPLESRGTNEVYLPKGVVPLNQCKIKDKVMGYLGSRGITEADVLKYAVMWWPENERVLFPFRNSLGNLVFWTARTIYKNLQPKYLHPSISKSDRVIQYIGSDDSAIYIVEGVFDAIRINKLGYTVVVLMGTDISDVIKDYLRATKKSVVLVLDNDAAAKQLKYEEELKRLLGEDQVKALYLPKGDVAVMGLQGKEGFGGFVRSRVRQKEGTHGGT